MKHGTLVRGTSVSVTAAWLLVNKDKDKDKDKERVHRYGTCRVAATCSGEKKNMPRGWKNDKTPLPPGNVTQHALSRVIRQSCRVSGRCSYA